MRKLGKIFIFLVLIFIVFLIVVAAYDPLKLWLVDVLKGSTGPVYTWASDTWAGIAATPIYQQTHVFIWFFGGMVVTVLVILLYRKDKIPFIHPATPTTTQTAMGEPESVIRVEEPVGTGVKKSKDSE